jgi:hypothetical protein
MLFSHHTTKMALAHRAQPPESLGVKGVKHSEDGGSRTATSSLFDQGDENVAKETKVKFLGAKGVNHSKDGGVKESNVSADSMLTSFLYHLIRHLSLTLSIPSLFDQGNRLNEIPNKAATMTVRALPIACR